MFTNATASNLNFNLYRGGKRFKSKKYVKNSKSRKQYKIGGESFFTPKIPDYVVHASKKCNTHCEQDAKKLCKSTCDAATVAALDVRNIGISREFIEDLTTRIKQLEDKNIQLTKDKDILEQKYSMLHAVTTGKH